MEWVLVFFFLAGAASPDTVAPASIQTINGFASKALCDAAMTSFRQNMAQPMPPGTAKPISFVVCVQTK